MTLSPGAKVQPKRSTLRSPPGLSAACSSIFSDRAPAPPRFIGHSTWMSCIGVEPEPLRDARLHQLDDPHRRGLRIVRRHEVEVAVALRPGEIGDDAPIDTVRGRDDPAPDRLAKHLGQPRNRDCARTDDVCQHLARPHRRQLIDVAHDQQRGLVGDRHQQCPHQHDVHHGSLVDHQQSATERVSSITPEPARSRIRPRAGGGWSGSPARWPRSSSWRHGR